MADNFSLETINKFFGTKHTDINKFYEEEDKYIRLFIDIANELGYNVEFYRDNEIKVRTNESIFYCNEKLVRIESIFSLITTIVKYIPGFNRW